MPWGTGHFSKVGSQLSADYSHDVPGHVFSSRELICDLLEFLLVGLEVNNNNNNNNNNTGIDNVAEGNVGSPLYPAHVRQLIRAKVTSLAN